MKFSYNWLREMIPDLNTDADELMRLITLRTAECEGLEEVQPPDSIIEVDNKSLTHRPDLWGHFGMAREIAAITRNQLRDPVDMRELPSSGSAPVRVEIEDLTLAPRYSALAFENVTVQPSPAWLQNRLSAIGLNPINNIVDVTNYVMAEIAQPMHAFDADSLHGGAIFVRSARAGESVTALNEDTYELTPSNLVIADERGPVAIAGVIGGLHSAIRETTSRVVLESANFQAASIRKTSAQLKLRTDASMRFEKAQDPENTLRALARAIVLLRQVSPGIRVIGGLADKRAEPHTPPAIELPVEWLERKLGRPVTEVQVREILQALEFGVRQTRPGVLSVTVPSWRATKDISVKDDLLEEVGRMLGFDSITPTAPLVQARPPKPNPERAIERRVRSMASALGFTEVYNYSFLSEEAARKFGFEPQQHLRVVNPIASDQTLLRRSLVPGIFSNLVENSKHFSTFRIFEIGQEIWETKEFSRFAAAIYGREGDGAAGLFELKHLADCLAPACEAQPAQARLFEHPGRSAEILLQGESIGRLFEFHPSLGLEGRGAMLELSLTVLLPVAATRYQPLRRFPVSAFDLSVVAPLREPAGDLRKHIESSAGKNLVSIEFVRQFSGPPLPEGRKSVSYRITVGDPARTLSSEEAGQIRAAIINSLESAGYELRL